MQYDHDEAGRDAGIYGPTQGNGMPARRTNDAGMTIWLDVKVNSNFLHVVIYHFWYYCACPFIDTCIG